MKGNLQPRGKGEIQSDLFPLIFGKDLPGELKEEEAGKVELFEQRLKEDLRHDDSIDEAIEKVVKVALAAEFGSDVASKKEAKTMIDTIVRGIMGDPSLRKQALMVISGTLGRIKKD